MQARNRGSRYIRIGLLAGLTFALVTAQVRAQTPEEFYKGRTVTLIIGSGADAGYDVYGRLLARHIIRHIPGQPHIVVPNMPRAGGIKAADYLGSIAVRDGSPSVWWRTSATAGQTRGSTVHWCRRWSVTGSRFSSA